MSLFDCAACWGCDPENKNILWRYFAAKQNETQQQYTYIYGLEFNCENNVELLEQGNAVLPAAIMPRKG
jgi:hypothetical protein